MGERETFSAPIGATTRTENGAWFTAVVTSTNAPRTATNNVAVHEAQHGVAAAAGGTEVIGLEIQKSGNTLGTTYLTRFDAAAAMAPYAMGNTEGTGSDVFKVTYLTGNPGAAIGEARRRLSNQTHTVNAVAVKLEDHFKIDGHTMKETMREADEIMKYGPELTVDIFIKNSDGSEKKMTQKTRGNNVVVSGEWIKNKKLDEDKKKDSKKAKRSEEFSVTKENFASAA